MNILYIHGFKSQFKEQSEKVQALNTLGKVFGVTLDYTKTFDEIKKTLLKFVLDKDMDIELIVGTSLGGYYSSVIGASAGVPFVAINPVVDPVLTLSKYIGDGFTFTGEAYTLKEETVTAYPGFALDGCGLILLDRGDELINSEETLATLDNFYSTKIFEGGNHRFAHINESLTEIKSYFNQASFVYGFGAVDD